VLCVGLSLIVPAERQRRAVVAIRALGGSVEYVKPDNDANEAFLRRCLPRDYFGEVREVDFSNTKVTDAGLAYLHGMASLQELNLGYTKVTDVGLSHLQRLTGLQELDLYGTQVTDAGLSDLHAITGLRRLSLNFTLVTDAGLAQLRQRLPKCQVFGP
jgi:hypothetical protein